VSQDSQPNATLGSAHNDASEGCRGASKRRPMTRRRASKGVEVRATTCRDSKGVEGRGGTCNDVSKRLEGHTRRVKRGIEGRPMTCQCRRASKTMQRCVERCGEAWRGVQRRVEEIEGAYKTREEGRRRASNDVSKGVERCGGACNDVSKSFEGCTRCVEGRATTHGRVCIR
jgi:hypothetical protein